ncbi:unnamed protein product [Lasius platythorax]|uniref:C2H2-type domain-containing protein n=1 Tax=Lasius platythorax TaxID=488582 RepID=A0AAV2NIP9_9HYME
MRRSSQIVKFTHCFVSELLAAYWNEYSTQRETLVFHQSLDWKKTSSEQQQQQRRPQQQQRRPQQQQRRPQQQQLPQQDHICKNCGKSYKQRAALLRHFKYECGKSPRFQCPYCRYRTKHRCNMYTHIRHKHFGQKIFAIDLEAGN